MLVVRQVQQHTEAHIQQLLLRTHQRLHLPLLTVDVHRLFGRGQYSGRVSGGTAAEVPWLRERTFGSFFTLGGFLSLSLSLLPFFDDRFLSFDDDDAFAAAASDLQQ